MRKYRPKRVTFRGHVDGFHPRSSFGGDQRFRAGNREVTRIGLSIGVELTPDRHPKLTPLRRRALRAALARAELVGVAGSQEGIDPRTG